jgi:hypothetical protein
MRRIGALAGVLLLVVFYLTCGWSVFFSTDKREFLRLKNRTAMPATADFDAAVTLPALLQPGDDRRRFSSARAAIIDGVVLDVFDARPEAANCYSWRRRDTHIELALSRPAPRRQRVTAEVTPPLRDWAAARGMDWSRAALVGLVGRRVRISGWLLFDQEHEHESENTNPGDSDNWRATAWEIHPITAIEVLR